MTAYPFQLLQEHYRLASLAKDKLNQCISSGNAGRRKSEYNLREVVGHANLLDRVLTNIDKIKYEYVQEQENKFRKRSDDFYYDSLYSGNYSYKHKGNVDGGDDDDDNSIFNSDDRLDIDCCDITTTGKGDSNDDDGVRSEKGNSGEEEEEEEEEEDNFIFTFSDNFPISPQVDTNTTIPDNMFYKCCCSYYVDKITNMGNDLDHGKTDLHSTYFDFAKPPPLLQYMNFPTIHYHKYV